MGETSGGDLEDERRGGGGEDAVEGEDDEGGFCGVDAEELEDAGEQQGIERGDPGGGASVAGEGVGVSVAGDKGAGDASHLPAELEMVVGEANAVGVGQRDVEDAEEEAGPEDGEGRFEERGSRRRCVGILHG